MNILVEQTSSGKCILRYNASLHKESNCLRKVWFTLFRGLVAGGGDKDFKMDYGTAFHRAMKSHYSGHPIDMAIKEAYDYYSKSTIPDSDWRSLSHLINSIMQYVAWYKKEGDLISPLKDKGRVPMLEIPFQYPFYSTPQVDVLLCGTLDFIGLYANTYPVIVDHKTTSMIHKETYLNGYVLSPQLMTYKMIYEILFPGSPIQCLINGIFIKANNKNEFMRSGLIDFTEHQMEQHRRGLQETVQNIVTRFDLFMQNPGEERLNSMFPENYTCCQQLYGMCPFLPLCMAATPEDQEGLIETMYEKRIYDPSKFQS